MERCAAAYRGVGSPDIIRRLIFLRGVGAHVVVVAFSNVARLDHSDRCDRFYDQRPIAPNRQITALSIGSHADGSAHGYWADPHALAGGNLRSR